MLITLRPRQNGRNFEDDIFKCIFLNENCLVLIKISLKNVPRDLISNIPALVQIMVWHRLGDTRMHKTLAHTEFHNSIAGRAYANEINSIACVPCQTEYTHQSIQMLYTLGTKTFDVKGHAHGRLTLRPFMMTSSTGNIFRVTGHLCGEFTGRR